MAVLVICTLPVYLKYFDRMYYVLLTHEAPPDSNRAGLEKLSHKVQRFALHGREEKRSEMMCLTAPIAAVPLGQRPAEQLREGGRSGVDGEKEGRRKEESRVQGRALGVCAKHSGGGPCDRTDMGSQIVSATGHPRGRCGICCHFMCLGSWAITYTLICNPGHCPQWCSQIASWLGFLSRSTVSQGASHTHFTFSTSVTPYKNDMHKHELIANH